MDRVIANRCSEKLLKNRGKIAARSIEHLLNKRPDLKKRLNRLSLLKMHRDLSGSIANLSGSIVADDPGLFRDHIVWSERYYRHRGINPDLLEDQLEALKKSIQESKYPGFDDHPAVFLNEGLYFLHHHNKGLFRNEEPPWSSESADYVNLLLNGNLESARTYIHGLFESKWELKDIITKISQPALHEIGRLWHTNQISSKMESKASQINRSIILGLFDKQMDPVAIRGTCVLYSPSGELHDLGITILAELLTAQAIEVHKFGPNIPDNELLRCLMNIKPAALGISVTMVYSLVPLENLIRTIRKQSELSNMKIIVGGYVANRLNSVDQCFGADIIAKDLKQGLNCIVEAIDLNN